MKFKFLVKAFTLALLVTAIISCDKEFDELGSGVLGDNPNNYLFSKINSDVVAYNYATGAVQSNNLGLNALGVYTNPAFGTTKASYVSQLELALANPTFNNPTSITIDSVYIYVPYFNKFVSTSADAETSTYTLDSIRGAGNFKLGIYENGYYLRNFDASGQLQTPQKYYSNQASDFDAVIGNNGVALKEITEFKFSADEIRLTYQKDNNTIVKSKLAPGMFLLLDKNLNDYGFFKQKIFNAPTGSLTNNSSFKDYFRGIYLKAENNVSSSDGTMASLNFAGGYIQIIYHQDKLPVPTSGDLRERKELRLNLAGNSVNLYENANNAAYSNALATANTTIGDERIFIKGQQGSVAVINLFTEAGENSLVNLKNKGWLINEANLTFYIDKDAMGNSPEPNRIYLYNLDDNTPIVDYFETSTSVNPKFNKLVFGGIAEKENSTDTKSSKYKIRLTAHVNNIINNDSTNVRLGLAVTELITNTASASLRNPTNTEINRIPVTSVINPLGTILYGGVNSPNVPAAKKMKLEIYYTKPN
ncbi:MAG: hypothetical protein ACI9XR_000704 [Flavobacterium sp.]|jgi:hypothetical protein